MRRALLLLLATVAATAITATADARLRVPTEVTFYIFCGNGICQFDVGNDWIYGGDVNSNSHKCSANRKVRVFEIRKGPDLLRGSDVSDSRGHWFVRRPDYKPVSSDYYAKAPKKKLRNGDVCAADRSPIVED
jgi:hypothetical protein